MDIGIYITELLEQRGEISIPELGYLVRLHIPGRFNEAENKFYPPHHEIEYAPYPLDGDDTLAEYIALKKNISLASAKYFTEKYVNTVKEDALENEVIIDGLGSFYTSNGKLAFKAAEQVDPSFFGYPPIEVTAKEKPTAPIVEEHIVEQVIEEPIIENNITEPLHIPEPDNLTKPERIIEPEVEQPFVQLPIIQQPVQPIKQVETVEEAYGEEAKPRSYGWLILLVVLLITALAVFGIYKLYPEQYKSAMTWVQNIGNSNTVEKPKVEVKKMEIVPANVDSTVTDTGKQVKPSAPPAQVKPTTPANDLVNQTSLGEFDPKKPWVVIAVSCYTEEQAAKAISNLKANGLEPFIVPNDGGAAIKIAVGAYTSDPQAKAALAKFLSAKQVPHDAYFTHITPKK